MRNRKYTRITIGGVDYSEYLRLPLTIQQTLNEQLDSAVVDLLNTPFPEPLKPFTPVELGGVTYILAEDSVTEIVGQGLYKHSLTLLEKTKEAERIICGAKAFTRPLVHDYTDGLSHTDVYSYNSSGYLLERFVASYISSPRLVGEQSIHLGDFWHGFDEGIIEGDIPSVSVFYGKTDPAPTMSGTDADDNTYAKYSVDGEQIPCALDDNQSPSSVIFNAAKEGIYAVFVEYGSYVSHKGMFTKIFVYESIVGKPTKTVAEVINTLLTTSETLREGLDSPRYRLEYTAEQEAIMAQPAPELHFANGRSLWENLREVGKYIHAIPRITGDVVTFDQLGSVEYADLSKGQRVAQTSSLNIGDYTAGLDTMANNLVNLDDEDDGSVTEPFDGGYTTMRATEEEARIQEGTGILLTTHPIEKIIKLELGPFTAGGKTYAGADLTSSIYEKREYDVLSSYSGGYPKSKSFAIFYTQGAKNIDGFWFKPQDKASDILNMLQNYAIANIVKAHTGITDTQLILPYTDLTFRITYIPAVTARARQYKPSYDGAFPSVIVHNQAANKLSAKALGENLRGQLAMMGNTADTVTYMFQRADDLPRAGTLYDDERYIASITARIYNDFVVAQMALAEGYNELGAFVEVNNQIRQFEIPASEDRYTVLEEFCVVTDKKGGKDDTNTAATADLKSALVSGLGTSVMYTDASLALVSTYDNDGEAITETPLAFPVTTLALGTSLYFGFRFADNFAAGRKAVATGEKYKYQDWVPYADPYYAEARTLAFRLRSGAKGDNSTPDALPVSTGITDLAGGHDMVSLGNYPILWHKDSADAGCITYQLHMVTDSGLIIGDGLTYFCQAVRRNPSTDAAQIYYYNHRINPLTGTTNVTDCVHETSVTAYGTSGYIAFGSNPTKPFKAWAIIKNGRFVLGKNTTEAPNEIYFTFKRRLQ